MKKRFTFGMAAFLMAACSVNVSAQGESDFPKYDFTPTDLVTEQPEGELRIYERNGENLTSFLGGIDEGFQSGRKLEVVFAEDGKTVWFYNIVSTAGDCFSWVKGELRDNKIVIPQGQVLWMVDYGTYYNAYVLCNIRYNMDPDATAYEIYECIPGDIELSYEDGIISLLPNSSGEAAIGLQRYSTDEFIIEYGLNYKWLGYGDVNSVYKPFDMKPSAAPKSDAIIEKYAFTYSSYPGGSVKGHLVDVAIEDDNFFVRGLSQIDATEYWANATIKDNEISFNGRQYLGEQRIGFSDYFLFLCPIEIFERGNNLFAEFTDETVFSWDSQNKTASSTGSMVMNSGNEMLLYSDIWCDMTLAPYEDVPAIPENPRIGADYFTDPDWGMTQIMVEIPCLDINGKYIDTQYLSYRMFVNGEPFTFVPGDFEYFDLEKPMEEIPYNFSSYDIEMLDAGIWAVTFYGDEPESIGVQTICTSGGETNMSDIVTYATSGIEESLTSEEPVSVKYFTTAGIEVKEDYKGLTICVEKYSDGTVKTYKRFNR